MQMENNVQWFKFISSTSQQLCCSVPIPQIQGEGSWTPHRMTQQVSSGPWAAHYMPPTLLFDVLNNLQFPAGDVN